MASELMMMFLIMVKFLKMFEDVSDYGQISQSLIMASELMMMHGKAYSTHIYTKFHQSYFL